jgi:hypothetical protein
VAVCSQLPQCLCIHIQRTQWIDHSMPVKRYEHVAFQESLRMDDYVYSTAGRHADRELRTGLLGGQMLFMPK